MIFASLFLRGEPLLVVLPELAAGVDARTSMANHLVAARWPGTYSLPLSSRTNMQYLLS
jgi:hypothetical protein